MRVRLRAQHRGTPLSFVAFVATSRAALKALDEGPLFGEALPHVAGAFQVNRPGFSGDSRVSVTQERIPDTSDRPGPKCRDVIRGSCQRAPGARVPVRSQQRTVESTVSEPQATACKIARVPEDPWRVRSIGAPVRVRRKVCRTIRCPAGSRTRGSGHGA